MRGSYFVAMVVTLLTIGCDAQPVGRPEGVSFGGIHSDVGPTAIYTVYEFPSGGTGVVIVANSKGDATILNGDPEPQEGKVLVEIDSLTKIFDLNDDLSTGDVSTKLRDYLRRALQEVE